MFTVGNQRDIEVHEELIGLDWKKDLVDMKLLSYLSMNTQCKQLMRWLIEERKIQLNWRDEEGRGVLQWTCAQDVDLGLVRYLIEEKKLRVEGDGKGGNCLDLACESYEGDKMNGAGEETKKRRVLVIDYLITRVLWGDYLLHDACRS